MMTRKSIDTILLSVAADKLSQREWDWMKMLKPMDPPPVMVARSILERRGDTAALARLQTTEAQSVPCWTSFLDAGGLCDIEVEAVTKMLACGTRITGVKEYGCDNPGCRHARYISNACHSRVCPSS